MWRRHGAKDASPGRFQADLPVPPSVGPQKVPAVPPHPLAPACNSEKAWKPREPTREYVSQLVPRFSSRGQSVHSMALLFDRYFQFGVLQLCIALCTWRTLLLPQQHAAARNSRNSWESHDHALHAEYNIAAEFHSSQLSLLKTESPLFPLMFDFSFMFLSSCALKL